jgi:hypothetical protein
MDHRLDRVHLFHRHKLEHWRIRHRPGEPAAGPRWHGVAYRSRVRAVCMGIRTVSVGPERRERGSGPKTTIRGDGAALLALLLPDHQVSSQIRRRDCMLTV